MHLVDEPKVDRNSPAFPIPESRPPDVAVPPEQPLSVDRAIFLACLAILLGFGCLMVYSASVTSWPTQFEKVYLSRHLIFVTLGVAAATVASCIPADIWRRLSPWIFIATVVLLGLAFVPGIGVSVKGARRWINAGPVRIQPSELAKIALPLLTAHLLVSARDRNRLSHWWSGTVPLWLPTLTMAPLVLFEPDLGTALFLVLSTLTLLWVGGWPLKWFGLGVLLAVPVLMTGLQMKDYQRERIDGFLRGWADWREAPYQLQQSLLSFGHGGLNGTGIGKGWQKLSYLPEANTDFVFAVVGEELGLVGSLSLIGLWGAILILGLMQLRNTPRDSYGWLVAFILLLQIVLQAVINIAVVTAMVPPKGISHPLLSAGGSNLISTLIAFGIICGVTGGAQQSADRPS